MKEIIKEREVVKGSDDRNVGPTEDSDHEEEIREEDFLEVILAKENLSEEEKMSIVLDILLGGYETTATLMGLIVYFISHAPLVFQKLKVPFFVSFPPSVNPKILFQPLLEAINPVALTTLCLSSHQLRNTQFIIKLREWWPKIKLSEFFVLELPIQSSRSSDSSPTSSNPISEVFPRIPH